MKGKLIVLFTLGIAWAYCFYIDVLKPKAEAKSDPVTIHITNSSPFEILIWIPTDLTGTNTSHTVPILVGPGYRSTIRYTEDRYHPQVEMNKKAAP